MIQTIPGSFVPTDAYAVERFEQVIRVQQPAVTPWMPVTDYSFEARKAIEGIHPQRILETFAPTAILDVGCGPGHLLRLLSEAREAWRPRWHLWLEGVDRSEALAEPPVGYVRTCGDVAGEMHPTCSTFDLVIYREVNEHLTLPQMARAVRNLCRFSNQWVYGTTRFHPAPTHLLDVATSDTLDPTHISLVTKPFLRMLFALEGFQYREDMAACMDWRQLGRTFVFERRA